MARRPRTPHDQLLKGEYVMAVEGFTALHYQYIQISLPALNAVEYVHRPQPLAVGLAALMHGPRRDELYEACLRRLTELEVGGLLDDARLFVLHNLVRTYVSLTAEEPARLLARLEREGAARVRTTELTWADRMRQEGEVKGRAEAVLVLLRERFGRVPAEVTERVQATHDAGRLEALLVRSLHVADPADLFD